MSNHTGFQNRGPDKASPERQGDVGWGIVSERQSRYLHATVSNHRGGVQARVSLARRCRGLTYGTRGWR